MNNYIWSNDKVRFWDVISPDTLSIVFDLGFGILNKQIIRLARVQSNTHKQDEAIQFIAEKLYAAKEYKVVTYKQGKLGKYLCDVFIDGSNLNTELLQKGYVRSFDPKAKR